MNLFLYAVCTLIWGSTYFVITFQIDDASPIASVFWRFALASAIVGGYCLITHKKMKYSWREHLLFAAQGVFLFSVNYMLTYSAESMISSGMTAVSYTAMVYYNMFGMWLFFKKPITWRVINGVILGGLGIVLIFYNEIFHFDGNSKTIWGLIIALLAALSASTGNMVSQKVFRSQIPVVVANSYGMLYGSLFTLLVGLSLHHSFAIPLTAKFLGAMVYLALFGSVFAFGAYLSLAGRIGAEKAAYSTVVSPIIALTLSSFFENFHWSIPIVLGIVLCLAGNVLILRASKKSA